MHRPPHRRRIGFVFQDALLLPHLSVRSNLGYGRFFTRKVDRRLPFDAVVQVLGIGHLLDRRPATLSGGERQRVAIGRALLASPRLLLMDEPLASLDAARKRELLPFIERLRDEFAIPILYVSHAAEEVARLADRVVLIEAGRVAASGRPDEVLGSAAPRDGPFRRGLDPVGGREGGAAGLWADGSVAPRRRHPRAGPARSRTDGDDRDPRHQRGHRHRSGGQQRPHPAEGRIVGLRMDEGPFALAAIELEGGAVLQASLTRLAVDQLGIRVGSEVVALVKTVAIPRTGTGQDLTASVFPFDADADGGAAVGPDLGLQPQLARQVDVDADAAVLRPRAGAQVEPGAIADGA